MDIDGITLYDRQVYNIILLLLSTALVAAADADAADACQFLPHPALYPASTYLSTGEEWQHPF